MKLNRVLYLLLALIFTLPFLPMLNPVTGTIIGNYYFRDAVTVLLASILIIVFIIANPKQTVKITIPQILIFIFILLLLIQSNFVTSYKSSIYEAAGVLLVGLILSMCISNYKNKDTFFKLINLSIIICCYLQIILSILQLINTNLNLSTTLYSFDATNSAIINFNILSRSGERIGGGLNQANNLADLLTWGLFANISYWANSNKRLQVLFCIVTLILLSFFISLTYSRIAIVFAIFMIIYGLIVWLKNKSYSKLLLIHGIALLGCIFIASKGYFNFAYSKYNQQTNTTTIAKKQIAKENITESNDSSRIANSISLINNAIHGKEVKLIASDSQRITLWQRGWREFIMHPILGVGWNYYGYYLFDNNISQNTSGLPQLTLPMNSHNLFIQVIATTGIVGIVIVLCFLIIILYNAWQQPLAKQITILGVISVILLHSQVEYPLFYVPFLYCFLILIAISDNGKSFVYKNKFFLNCIIGIISGIAIWQTISGINNFLILAQLKKPDNYIQNNPINNITNKYRISMNPLWSYYVDADFAQKLNFSQITPQNKNLFAITYNATKNVQEFSPYPSYTVKLAYMESLVGNHKQACILINQLLNNYSGFTTTINDWIAELTQDNLILKKQMLSCL